VEGGKIAPQAPPGTITVPSSRASDETRAASVELLSRRATLSLLFGGFDFRHRQVLKLKPVDDTVMRYQVSLDFTIPKVANTSGIVTLDHLYVPLAVVPKHTLGEVDLKDEWGKSLPALNRTDEWDLNYRFMRLFWLTNYFDPDKETPAPLSFKRSFPKKRCS
jgi:hypothetical protein